MAELPTGFASVVYGSSDDILTATRAARAFLPANRRAALNRSEVVGDDTTQMDVRPRDTVGTKAVDTMVGDETKFVTGQGRRETDGS